MATRARRAIRPTLAGLLALAVSLQAQAFIPDEILGYDTDIPLTAQTSGDSLFGPGNSGAGWNTVLLPAGTVLDFVLTGFICVHLSGELTSMAFTGAEKKIVEAREDAAMYLATEGAHQGVRLEAAIEHLRRFPQFDTYSRQALSELILLVSLPAADGGV